MFPITKDILILTPIPPIILTLLIIIVNLSGYKPDWMLLFIHIMLLICLVINFDIALKLKRNIYGENLENLPLNNPTYNPINDTINNDIIVNNKDIENL